MAVSSPGAAGSSSPVSDCSSANCSGSSAGFAVGFVGFTGVYRQNYGIFCNGFKLPLGFY